jgi:hypothetical protein
MKRRLSALYLSMRLRLLVLTSILCVVSHPQALPSLGQLTMLTNRESVDLTKIAYVQFDVSADNQVATGSMIAGGYPQQLTPEALAAIKELIQSGRLPQLTAFSGGEYYDAGKITSFRLPVATLSTDRFGEVIIVDGWETDPSVAAENTLRQLMGLPQASY